MNYKLIGENDILNPREQILKNRNTTMERLNPTIEVVEDYSNYDNMDRAIKTLMHHIKNNGNIGIIVDEDCDGMCSATIMYRYLKEVLNYEADLLVHNKAKAHGISSDLNIEKGFYNLIISPDGGTNNREEIKALEKEGTQVLVLDHHLKSDDIEELDYGIIVNNQTSKNVENKALCGAGVVYKFLCALSDEFNLSSPSKYLDLVAIANVGDAMDISSLETRYYVKLGLEDIQNSFIKAIMEVKSFEMSGKINPMSFSFNVIPLINAVIRSGTFEEKMVMIWAFISDDEEYCNDIAKKLKNIKSKQDSYVKRNMEKILKTLTINEEDRIIFVDGTGLKNTVFGLIATKISDKFKLPCIMYSINETTLVCGGSARGLEPIHLKEDLAKSQLVISCDGHSNAHGILFEQSNLESLKKYMNNLYKDVYFGNSKVYDVDFEIYSFFLDNLLVKEMAYFEDEVSRGFEQPLIVIKNVDLALTDENVKGKLNVIFEVGNVKIVKRFASKVWKEEFLYNPITVDIIGKCVKGYNDEALVEIVDLIIKG